MVHFIDSSIYKVTHINLKLTHYTYIYSFKKFIKTFLDLNIIPGLKSGGIYFTIIFGRSIYEKFEKNDIDT